MWEVGTHKVWTRDWHSGERHAYFKTTKQDIDQGGPEWGKERRGGKKKRKNNLERSYYQLNSCHYWAKLQRILRYNRLNRRKEREACLQQFVERFFITHVNFGLSFLM